MNSLEQAIAGSDVVVAPQELQRLTVPYLWAKRRRICKSWIWWDTGITFKLRSAPAMVTQFKEGCKRFMTERADGLITYTEGGADYWRKQGYPHDRVIPYFNTLDVEGLRKAGADITEHQLTELRRKLGLEGKRVLLFSGRLYAEKRVDFLLKAFAILKKTHPNVGLLIIGGGEELINLRRLARQLDLRDAHFLGEIVDPKETAGIFFSGGLDGDSWTE